MTGLKKSFFAICLSVTLRLAQRMTNYCNTRISSRTLKDLRQFTREMDELMYRQMMKRGIKEDQVSKDQEESDDDVVERSSEHGQQDIKS